MAHIDHSSGEVVARIVYFGPPRGGKTTNLELVCQHASLGDTRILGAGASHAPLFDGLLHELGSLVGRPLRLQFCRIQGPVQADPSLRSALKGADTVVFVADSQADALAANLACLESLRRTLRAGTPVVMQYNKFDLPTAVSLGELEARLNAGAGPALQAIAIRNIGVEETLRVATRLCFRSVELALRSGETEMAAPSGARADTQRWVAGEAAAANSEPEAAVQPRLSTDKSLAFRSLLEAAQQASQGPNRHSTLPAMPLPPTLAQIVTKPSARAKAPPKKG
ncbi:MAG: hypothetical protein AB7O37_19705 [Vicinamibacteria bacterium]